MPPELMEVVEAGAREAGMSNSHFHRHAFAEHDAIAEEAVRRAVADQHTKGIPSHHLEEGQLIEVLPDGTRRVVATPEAAKKAVTE